jgi:hypothetical protein
MLDKIRKLLTRVALAECTQQMPRTAFAQCRVFLMRELAGILLNDLQWEDLTREWYQDRIWSESIYDSNIQFSWERKTIADFFIAPPGQVLVISSGKGRELRFLAQIGYSTYAVESDECALRIGTASIAGDNLIGSTHATFLDIATGRIQLPMQSFHGIIVGWGALAHMPSVRTLREFLSRLAALYTKTPILLSWPKIQNSKITVRVYRSLRSLLPHNCCRFQQTIHWKLGPAMIIKHRDLQRELTAQGFTILTSSPQVSEYEYVVIQSS